MGKNKIFVYKGYHFVPERKFTKSETKDFCTLSKHLKTDFEFGMCKYKWKKHNYSYVDFYESTDAKEIDLFRCVENSKLYVPCENELFEFVEEV